MFVMVNVPPAKRDVEDLREDDEIDRHAEETETGNEQARDGTGLEAQIKALGE